MRIATGQYASIAGDVDANVRTALEAVAAADGARVLVMPELFLTGYAMPPAVIDVDDARLTVLDEAATAAGMIVLIGAALPGPADRPTISILAIGGGVRQVYDKQHLCGQEQNHFAPGEYGVVLEVDGWMLGLAVCYDGCFPEHARAAADAGAEVYVAPIAYFTGSEHRRDVYYAARAVDNGIYAVTSGLAGECAGVPFVGGSAIHDPEARTVATVESDTYGVAIATLDKDEIARTRTAHPMHAERREASDMRVLSL